LSIEALRHATGHGQVPHPREVTSPAQMLSHDVWQQNGSLPQTHAWTLASLQPAPEWDEQHEPVEPEQDPHPLVVTSPTQMSSHAVWQQNGSLPQTQL